MEKKFLNYLSEIYKPIIFCKEKLHKKWIITISFFLTLMQKLFMEAHYIHPVNSIYIYQVQLIHIKLKK